MALLQTHGGADKVEKLGQMGDCVMGFWLAHYKSGGHVSAPGRPKGGGMQPLWMLVPLLSFGFASYAAAQTAGKPACTNSEIAAINLILQEGFNLGARIAA